VGERKGEIGSACTLIVCCSLCESGDLERSVCGVQYVSGLGIDVEVE
jgi:hypothetical protein